ncbi:MAG: hypothetical protein GWO76_01260 [Proteobacteria bacterium]|nr:hypothetical protein [Pseudomonadota bacterium]
MQKFFFIPLLLYLSLSLHSQSLRFGIGSCAAGGDGNNDDIFQTLEKERLDHFLWLGDNAYYTEKDWKNEESMLAAMQQRHASPLLASFLQSPPQLAIWDDHDFGPNDSDSSFAQAAASAKVFEKTWPDNPTNLATNGDLRWDLRMGSVLFVGLDDRTHRGPKGTQILGKGQLQYLRDLLDIHRDAAWVFIAVGSQVLNEAEVFENYSRFPERETFLSICQDHTGQVIFLTGDRHHGEINQSQRGSLVDITSSPLTSRSHMPSAGELKANVNLIKGTLISTQHYTVIELSEDGLAAEVIFKDAKGMELLVYSLQAQGLE